MTQSTKQPRFNGIVADALILGGTISIGFGLALWRTDVAFVVVGAIALALGVKLTGSSST